MKKIMKLDRFVKAILITVLLAYLFPQLGRKDSGIPLDQISDVGISLIFFFYGLKLSPEKVKTGLRNWKLHILVQSAVFLLFPLLVIGFAQIVNTDAQHNIWLGFLFLAALPSTVSTSVVMVSLAKGNVPAAIFNASISGLIGIVVTPIWVGLFLDQNSANFDLIGIYVKLFIEILLPLSIGLLLHRYFGKQANRFGTYLTLFDKSIILLIIYKSFVRSFEDSIFQSVGIQDFLIIYAAILGLFLVVYFSVGSIADYLGFDRKDKTTAQFCGTKKSLVHGTVFSKILFPSSISTGIILLPLILFHMTQIFIISIIAGRLARTAKEAVVIDEG
jgi:sodium/bile acid cotransporter 7